MNSIAHPPTSSHPGILHFIPPNLSAFEPTKPLVRSTNINTLLWIGGMFDTFLSVDYPLTLAQALPPNWSLMTASLDSAGKSWGVGSIAQDAEEMGKIVSFIKTVRPGGKVVIMGHSTGCQDCMEYVVGAEADTRPAVDGAILQAPVSDREALEQELPKAFLEEANSLAEKMCRERHEKDALPNRLTAPAFGRMAITAKRWLDVASPRPLHLGADDYFSSDLEDERLEKTFGKFPAEVGLLILEGGSDESVPKHIDKVELVKRWTNFAMSGGGHVDEERSGVIEGASHNLNGNPKEVVGDLVRRVTGFVGLVESRTSARI